MPALTEFQQAAIAFAAESPTKNIDAFSKAIVFLRNSCILALESLQTQSAEAIAAHDAAIAARGSIIQGPLSLLDKPVQDATKELYDALMIECSMLRRITGDDYDVRRGLWKTILDAQATYQKQDLMTYGQAAQFNARCHQAFSEMILALKVEIQVADRLLACLALLAQDPAQLSAKKLIIEGCYFQLCVPLYKDDCAITIR